MPLYVCTSVVSVVCCKTNLHKPTIERFTSSKRLAERKEVTHRYFMSANESFFGHVECLDQAMAGSVPIHPRSSHRYDPPQAL